MTGSERLSRRRFLQQSAAAAGLAVPCFIPSSVLASAEEPGANDRVGVGYIGVGRRGTQLMRLPPDAQIVAVVDVDPTRAGTLARVRKCRPYSDYREMLEAKDVDAVVVATPDHWHALPSIHACQAGKDVYCEKPLSLTIREGQAMVRAARKHERVFQVGCQRRSSLEHRIGCELIRSGRIGKVKTVATSAFPSPWLCRFPGESVPEGLDWDMWCGQTEPVPFHRDIYIQRSRPGWISLRPYSGGEITGNGVHGVDLVQWALGMDHTCPVEVWAEGGKLEDLVYEAPEDRGRGNAHGGSGREITYRYANGVTLKLGGGPLGGAFVGENGKIEIGSGSVKSDPPEIFQEALKDASGQSRVSHLQNWIECIKSREKPAADVEIGHRATVICHLGNIARWVGRKLKWDPENEVFPEDDEANTHLERPMRKPYQLPDTV